MDRAQFITKINNSEDKNMYLILYQLPDELKKDKEIVYIVFKRTNLIDDFNYKDKSIKELYLEILHNLESLDNEVMNSLNRGGDGILIPRVELSILPNELKNDVDIVEDLLRITYRFVSEKKCNTVKELHLEYANYIKEQLDNSGSIYGVPLNYSTDFSEELLNDQEFVMSIIDSDRESDKKVLYERYGLKQLEEEKDDSFDSELNQYRLSELSRMSGKSYIKKYGFEAAICKFEEGIEHFPYYHGCYIDKADCLVKLGRLDEAIDFLKEIITSDELKKASKKYSICSNEATYTKYTYRLFIKKLEAKLLDTEKKKERGYVYKPKYNHFY